MSSCNSDYIPKPRAYPKFTLPEKAYQHFNSPYCPFQFEYPVYADIVRDTVFFNELAPDQCWLNLRFNKLGSKLHLSYKPLGSYRLDKLLDDTHFLTFKHTIKAEYIDEQAINRSDGLRGLIYHIGGNAASSIQFYLTDSSNHFLRGALYFGSTPNADSLRPIIEFINADIQHMINTFQWTE